MAADFMRLGESRKVFSDWTDPRIAAGALPRSAAAAHGCRAQSGAHDVGLGG